MIDTPAHGSLFFRAFREANWCPLRLKAFLLFVYASILANSAEASVWIDALTPWRIAMTFALVGTLKWFDDARGYGFLTQDAPGAPYREVLAHRLVFRDLPRQAMLPGCRLTCLVRQDDGKGLRVSEILDYVPDPDWLCIQVAWYSCTRGFGFLADPPRGDIFVHRRKLQRTGLQSLRSGQQLWARVAYTERGRTAVDLARPIRRPA